MPKKPVCFCHLAREEQARVVQELAEQPPHLVERVVRRLGVVAACPVAELVLPLRVVAHRLGRAALVPTLPPTLH